MNENQKNINQIIQRFHTLLRRYDTAVSSYNGKLKEINIAPLIDEEKARRRSNAAADFRAAIDSLYADFSAQLEALMTQVEQMAALPPICDELNTAVALATASGSQLEADTRVYLISTLRGRLRALTALRAVFAAHDIPTAELDKRYIFTPESVRADLDSAMSQVFSGNIGGAYLMGKKLEKAAELLGVELTSHFTSENEAEYLDMKTRQAFGLI